jgi:hypothetical protein
VEASPSYQEEEKDKEEDYCRQGPDNSVEIKEDLPKPMCRNSKEKIKKS